MVWYFGSLQGAGEEHAEVPAQDPLLGYAPSLSQKATLKYFFVVGALVVVQILLGVVTAHYGVEGSGCYGVPIDRVLPYAATRTWHVQLGIFWIATAWLATGLYVAPAVGGGGLRPPPLHGACSRRWSSSSPARWPASGSACSRNSAATCGSGSDTRATSTSTWGGCGSCCSWAGWCCGWR
jgi:hypothetical protein